MSVMDSNPCDKRKKGNSLCERKPGDICFRRQGSGGAQTAPPTSIESSRSLHFSVQATGFGSKCLGIELFLRDKRVFR